MNNFNIKNDLTVTGSATISGNIFAANLSGINTGDQDLSVYAPLSGATFTGNIITPSISSTTITVDNLSANNEICLPDDKKLYFGTDKDTAMRYDSANGRILITTNELGLSGLNAVVLLSGGLYIQDGGLTMVGQASQSYGQGGSGTYIQGGVGTNPVTGSLNGPGGAVNIITGSGGSNTIKSGSTITGHIGGSINLCTAFGDGGSALNDGLPGTIAIGGVGTPLTIGGVSSCRGGVSNVANLSGTNIGGAGGSFNIRSGGGGAGANAALSQGGTGGSNVTTLGSGGSATGATCLSGIGGDGGSGAFTAGTGGGAGGGTLYRKGGTGGLWNFNSGNGGVANTTAGGLGGSGGGITFNAGNGAGANQGYPGSGGTISFKSGTPGLSAAGSLSSGAYGDIIFGTRTADFAKFNCNAPVLGTLELPALSASTWITTPSLSSDNVNIKNGILHLGQNVNADPEISSDSAYIVLRDEVYTIPKSQSTNTVSNYLTDYNYTKGIQQLFNFSDNKYSILDYNAGGATMEVGIPCRINNFSTLTLTSNYITANNDTKLQALSAASIFTPSLTATKIVAGNTPNPNASTGNPIIDSYSILDGTVSNYLGNSSVLKLNLVGEDPYTIPQIINSDMSNIISGNNYMSDSTVFNLTNISYNDCPDIQPSLNGFVSNISNRGSASSSIGAGIIVETLSGCSATSQCGMSINVTATSGSTVTENIGLNIADVTGATNNYAIKTGLGKVQFGDQVTTPSLSATSLSSNTARFARADNSTISLFNDAPGYAIETTGHIKGQNIEAGYGTLIIRNTPTGPLAGIPEIVSPVNQLTILRDGIYVIPDETLGGTTVPISLYSKDLAVGVSQTLDTVGKVYNFSDDTASGTKLRFTMPTEVQSSLYVDATTRVNALSSTSIVNTNSISTSSITIGTPTVNLQITQTNNLTGSNYPILIPTDSYGFSDQVILGGGVVGAPLTADTGTFLGLFNNTNLDKGYYWGFNNASSEGLIMQPKPGFTKPFIANLGMVSCFEDMYLSNTVSQYVTDLTTTVCPSAGNIRFSGSTDRTIIMGNNNNTKTSGFALSMQAGGGPLAGADKAGGTLRLKSGEANGTASSSIEFYTATAGTAGTTRNTPSLKWTINGAGTLSGNSITHSGIRNKVAIKTSDYTLTSTDDTIVCNSATPFAVILPVATATGQTYNIKNVNTGAITLSGNAAETIDGSSTRLINQWDNISVIDYDTGKWAII